MKKKNVRMKNVKKKLGVLGVCFAVVLAVSMLGGCSLDRKANDAAGGSGSVQTKKEVTPTGQPTVTKAAEQDVNGKSDAGQSDGVQVDGSDVQNGGENSAGADEGNGDGSEIPKQGFFNATLYGQHGVTVELERADDGEFYDSTGALYPGVDDASINLDPVTNEAGVTFYWRESDVVESEELPFQGERQAMVYDIDTGDGFVIERGEDGIWRDADGVSFGDAEDALLSGEPVTNENGETYYWTLPEE